MDDESLDDVLRRYTVYGMRNVLVVFALVALLVFVLSGCVGGKCSSSTPNWERGVTCW